MELVAYIAVFGLGCVIGAAAMWRRAVPSATMAATPDTSVLETLQEELNRERIRCARFETQAQQTEALALELKQEREQAQQLKIAAARLETTLVEQAKASDEKIQALTQVRGQIQTELKIIAADALTDNRSKFVEMANEKITPLQETLKKYKDEIDKLEKERSGAHGALSAELKMVIETQNAVRAETSKLVNALKSAPKTRGRWGEHTLRNVLELAGLSQHCDFTTEESFTRDGDTMRPDVIVNLPGGRNLVIDAKTPLSGYLDAVEATDEAERDAHLAMHVKQVRTHVNQLAAKAYWDGLTVTPDFVVMFIPGDNFFTAAIERDPTLFEDAAKKRVVIVTPATLIALAKAVGYGWRQEKVAENAKKVHDLGRELYKRLATMSDHITKCGAALSKSVEFYNKFVGSLERNVMPQARKFNELEVEGTASEISVLEPVGQEPRALQLTRDLAEITAAAVESEAAA